MEWVLHNYLRLRKLPNFSAYSLLEILQVDILEEYFQRLMNEWMGDDLRYLLPLVDVYLPSSQEQAPELAAWLFDVVSRSNEGADGFGAHYPDELKHIRQFLPNQSEETSPKFDAAKVLEVFEQTAVLVPRLPERLPAWSGAARARSMLAPLEGGYCTHTPMAFLESLMRRRN